jgi:divinyl chlorophyllide a 8-vinyl-reductase
MTHNQLPPPLSQIVGGSMDSADEIKSKLFASGPVDAVISCIASRSGTPSDAWRVDHAANVHLLDAALAADAPAQHFVMLSAFCVRKPELVVRGCV